MTEYATVYTISASEDSALGVEVLKGGLLGRKKKHLLFFEKFKGELQLIDKNPASSKIELTIDSSSIMCRDKTLKEKKRRAIADSVRKHALATDAYPNIRFSSTSIRPKALRGFVVTGTLQIRETIREVTVNMAFNPIRKHEFQLDGDATLRLSDFGLPRPSAMFGLVKTEDEIMAHLLLWAVPNSQSQEART